MGRLRSVFKVFGSGLGVTVGAAVGYQLPYLMQTKRTLDIDVKPPRMEVNGVDLFPAVKTFFSIIPQPVKYWMTVQDVGSELFYSN